MFIANKIEFKAFTLAEVLITLLIIGVVASLTISNIINDTQDAEYKTAAKKAYYTMSSALNQMKQDYGSLQFYNGNPASFKPVFMNYFNIAKDCGYHTCVSNVDPSDVYKSMSGQWACDIGGGEGQFVTSDGMFVNIQNSANTTLGIIIIVDVNGYQKGPNVYGEDTFWFDIVDDKLLPMGASGTNYAGSTYCNRSISGCTRGVSCAYYVIQNQDY
jgi:prepilin-type N-terminal cleavage/methylation domain-containing protein